MAEPDGRYSTSEILGSTVPLVVVAWNSTLLETAEAVGRLCALGATPLKRGVNESASFERATSFSFEGGRGQNPGRLFEDAAGLRLTV